MRFCIVDEASSLSRGFVDCPQELAAANTPAGCIAVPAAGLEVGNYVLHQGRLLAIGEPPSPGHVYLHGQGWVLQRTAADAWAQVRRQRDDLLAATDWRVVRATEAGQPLPAQWQSYRKALRDITQQSDPLHIVWPVAPEEGN